MNRIFTFIWKIWLRLNPFTPEVDNAYFAEVSTVGRTIHNEDIAQMMIDEGSEINYETILSIINRRDRIIMKHVQSGGSAQDRCTRISPRVPGVWIGEDAKFDPATHKPTVDLSITPEFHEMLSHVGVEVLGVKDSGAHIGMVTDGATGKTDGTVSPQDDVIITGDKLKVVPADEEGIGVFLINNTSDEVYPVTHRLMQNDPKKVIARLPALPAGEYTLQIVTRYSHGGTNSSLLHAPRNIVYKHVLRVE